jgi:hypothetical protein
MALEDLDLMDIPCPVCEENALGISYRGEFAEEEKGFWQLEVELVCRDPECSGRFRGWLDQLPRTKERPVLRVLPSGEAAAQ